MMKFEVGVAYIAIPALEGARRKFVIVAGRKDSHIQLAWVEDLSIEPAEVFDFGREFIQTKRRDGMYSVSAACPVNTDAAADVLEFIQNRNRGA